MKRWVKYVFAISAAGGMAGIVLWSNDFGKAEGAWIRLKILADAFTVPGVLLMTAATLIWVASQGFFDGIGYAGRSVLRTVIPFLSMEDEKFYDYKQRRADDRIRGYSYLFYVGAAFFVVSLGFLAAYYRT